MTTNNNQLKVAADSTGSAVMELAPETRLRRQAGVVLCHVDGKHMLVPAMTNKVNLDCLFLLNDSGVLVWEHLDGRRRLENIGEVLATAFGIAPEMAVEDAAIFLSTLLDHKLVELAEPHWY
jgi:hypothetical protein